MDHKSKRNLELAFLKAVSNGDVKEALKYLKKNIDTNCRNAIGLPPLLLAANRNDVTMIRELLKWNIDVNQTSKKNNTALHLCCMAGYIDCAKILVEAGANINAIAHNGLTPLHIASVENDVEMVEYILKNGGSTAIKNKFGQTPLTLALLHHNDLVVSKLMSHDNDHRPCGHDNDDAAAGGGSGNDDNKNYSNSNARLKKTSKLKMPFLHGAVKKNDIAGVMSYLKKLQDDQNIKDTDISLLVNEPLNNGYTPLHIACHFNNLQLAQILIKSGADVNHQAQNFIAPLHIACKLGFVEICSLLLDNGADINITTKDQLTPLHCSSRSGHTEVVQFLVSHGAFVAARTKSYLTPLHLSVQGDHVITSDVLLKNGANIDDVSSDHLTALHVASHCGNYHSALFLLENNCLINAKARNGFTALHIACKKNRLPIIQLLLKFHAAIEATTETGLTALHVASFMGYLDIVRLLVESGAQMDCRNLRLESPLHLAMRGVQHEVVEYLLSRGADINCKAKEHQTILHIAAHQNNVQMCQYLIQHGACINSCTIDLYTSLHLAILQGNEEVVDCLLKLGADVYVLNKRGLSPLHLAAKHQRLKIMELLLGSGCPVDITGKNMLTPLHISVHYDSYESFHWLLRHGADVHAEALNGHSALHIASRKDRLKLIDELLHRGVNVDVKSKNGFTALHLACSEGHESMVEVLLNSGAECNCTLGNMLTPMHLAAQEDRVRVAVFLVARNALIDPQTKAGYTPLHTACHFGRMAMVKFLLSHYANPNMENKYGHTPLHQATQQGHWKIVGTLLSFGANPNILSKTGETALFIAEQLNFTSIIEILKSVTTVTTTTTTNINATTTTTTSNTLRTTRVPVDYKLMVPETMQEETRLIELDDNYATIGSKRYIMGHDDDEEEEDEEGPKFRHQQQHHQQQQQLLNHAQMVSQQKYQQQEQQQHFLLQPNQQQLLLQPHHQQHHQQQQQQQLLYQRGKQLQRQQQHQQLYNSSCNIIVDKQQLENELKYTSEQFINRFQMEPSQSFTSVMPLPEEEGNHYQHRHPVKSTTSLKPLSIFRRTSNVTINDMNSFQRHKSLKDVTMNQTFQPYSQIKSGRSESNLNHSIGLYCKLIHPKDFTSTTNDQVRFLPQLTPGQALASWIVQCFPAGKIFSRPVLIDVPHFACLRGGEREVQVLRCSDGCNWREHISPRVTCNRATVALLRPIFKGTSIKNDLYKKRFVRIITAKFPMYFALVSRVSESHMTLCLPGSMLSPPDQTVPIFLRVGQHEHYSGTDMTISISSQKVSQDLFKKTGQQQHLNTSPVVHIKPFGRLIHPPMSLHVACSFLKNIKYPLSNSCQGDEVKVHVYSSLMGGHHWNDVTNDVKIVIRKSKVNDPIVILPLKTGGSFLITDNPLSSSALNSLSKQLLQVPFYATHQAYVKRVLIGDTDAKGKLTLPSNNMKFHNTNYSGGSVGGYNDDGGGGERTDNSVIGGNSNSLDVGLGCGSDNDPNKGSVDNNRGKDEFEIEFFCGTADVSESFAEEKLKSDEWMQLYKSKELEVYDNTYQVLDFQLRDFEIIDNSLKQILFRASQKNSLLNVIKVFPLRGETFTHNFQYCPVGFVKIFKQLVDGISNKMNLSHVCDITFGSQSFKDPLLNGPIIKPDEYYYKELGLKRSSSAASPSSKDKIKEQYAPFAETIKREKLQAVEIDFEGDVYKSTNIKSEVSFEKVPKPIEPIEPKFKTSVDEGDIQSSVSSTEYFKLCDDESFLKSKSIQTNYFKPLTENTYESNVLIGTKNFDKQIRKEYEEYSIKLMSGYISPNIGANLIDLTFQKKIYFTVDNQEAVDSTLFLSISPESTDDSKSGDIKYLDSKKYEVIKIIEGPSEFRTERYKEHRKINSEAILISERIITTQFTPVFEVFHSTDKSEKKRLLKKTTCDVKVIENKIEFPRNISSLKMEDLIFKCNITYGEELVSNGITAFKKVITTHVLLLDLNSVKKDENCLEQVFECPIEKITKMTSVEKLLPGSVVEHRRTLITQWVKPLIKLKFKKDALPDLTLEHSIESTDIRDVLVNFQCGKIECHAKNCDVSIIVIPEVVTTENSMRTPQSSKNSVNRIVYNVKIKSPRVMEKITEGVMTIKNSVEEFNSISKDGEHKQYGKIFTAKHFKPVIKMTEIDGKISNTEKSEILVKSIVKEFIFMIPKSKVDINDYSVSINVVNNETVQPDHSILNKSTTKIILIPKHSPLLEKEVNNYLTDDEYYVEEQVQVNKSDHTTFSLEKYQSQHDIETKTRIKKYFKKLDCDHKNKLDTPSKEEVMDQFITEKILESPENISNLNDDNLFTRTTDEWIKGKTDSGAPRFHHIITTKVFLKDGSSEYEQEHREPGYFEEIEGEILVINEINEIEKMINGMKTKEKTITNKYIRPITTLKYNENSIVPDITVREELIKIEINELIMELDCELSNPDDCILSIDNYNYIKYLPHGVPVNTEVTRITARVKSDMKEQKLTQPEQTFARLDEIVISNSFDTVVNDTILLSTNAVKSIELPCRKLEVDNSKLELKSNIEYEMKQKVNTNEYQQLLPNGYLKKIKTLTINHYQVEKFINSINDVDVKEKLLKIEVQEIITIVANIKIEPFVYNCKTVLTTNFERSTIDNNIEVEKSVVKFVVIPANTEEADANLMEICKVNQLLDVNYGLVSGDMDFREEIHLDEIILNDSTIQTIKRIVLTKFRPLYILKSKKGDKTKYKFFLRECIEEVCETETVLNMPKNIREKNALYDFDLKDYHHEYIEYFKDGVLHKKRKIIAELILSKSSDKPFIEVEESIENKTDVIFRKDTMYPNGSLYREIAVKHSAIKPLVKLMVSSEFFLECSLKDQIIYSKNFNLIFSIPTFEMINENNCSIEIFSHVTQMKENEVHNFQVHFQPSTSENLKTFKFGEVIEKLTEDGNQTFLDDGTLVKWKTLYIYSHCPLLEILDQTKKELMVTELLLSTDILLVVVELGREVFIDKSEKYFVDITKDVSCINLPNRTSALKTVIKYVINKDSGVSLKLSSKHSNHHEKKVDRDTIILNDGTKVIKNIVTTNELKPYYEIAETREPMLKEELISQNIDETEIHFRPSFKLFNSEKPPFLQFKSCVFYNKNKKNKKLLKIIVETTNEKLLMDCFKEVVDNKTCVGPLDSMEKISCETLNNNKVITECKSWSKVLYTPIYEFIWYDNAKDIFDINFLENIISKISLNTVLKLNVGKIESRFCDVVIDIDYEYCHNKQDNYKPAYVLDDEDNTINSQYVVVEYRSNVRLAPKPEVKNSVEPVDNRMSKAVTFESEPKIIPEPQITTKCEEGDVMVKKTEQVFDEKLQDGSTVRKTVTTNHYFKHHIEKIYIDDVESACNITEIPVNLYIEESMIHMPAGVNEYDPNFWKMDVISVIESEYKQPDGTNVEKKTMHLVLTPNENISTQLLLKTNDIQDDAIDVKRIEGDIQTNIKISESEESLEDDSLLKKKCIITKFIKPITERTFKNGILINEAISFEEIGREIEEIYLNLPIGVIEPFGSNLDTETSINQYEETSPEQLPVKRKIINMIVKLKPESQKSTEMDKVDGSSSSHKRFEGDLISSTSYSERTSLADDGSKVICKRTTTRFFRPVADITIKNGHISNAEINEQNSHFDISEYITELAPDIGINETNVVNMLSEEIFNDKTLDGVPILRNVKTTKVVKALAPVQQYSEESDDEDTELLRITEIIVDGQIYKKIILTEKDLIQNKNRAVLNSLYPSLFLKNIEITPAIKVYSHTIENQPIVNSKVKEFVEILPNGTKVKRVVTETAEKRTVVKKLALENNELKKLNLKEIFDLYIHVNASCSCDNIRNKINNFETTTFEGDMRKVTKISNSQKFSSETEFMVTTTQANNVDEFYDNNIF